MTGFSAPLHACDINALLRLDKVFTRDHFPSPYYISRRKNTFIVGLDHDLLGLDLLERDEAAIRVDGHEVAVAQIGQEQIDTVGHGAGAQRVAEAVFAGITDTDRHDYLEVRRRGAWLPAARRSARRLQR